MKNKLYWYIGGGAASLFFAGVIVHVLHLPDWAALPLFVVLLAISIWSIRSL